MKAGLYRYLRLNPLPLILLVALLLRLIYLYQYAASPFWEILTVDNNYHHHWAEVLASGDIFGGTTYFRAPGYPIVLGILYYVFGSSLWVGRLLGLVIGLASIGMTYRIGRLIFCERTALVAAAIHALYPLCIYFDFELLLDPMFTLLLQMAVFYFFKSYKSDNSIRAVALSGIWFGLAAITRPTALIVALVALLFLAIHYRASWLWVRRIILFLAGIAICVAPITIRNVVVAEDPVLISSQGGINFYLGNNDAADGVSAIMPMPLGYNWRLGQITTMAEQDLGFAPKPGDVSSYWTGRAAAWIVSHPDAFVSLLVKKIVYSVSDMEVSNNRDLPRHFRSFRILDYNPISFGWLIPLSLLTVFFSWRSKREIKFLSITIFIYLVVGAFFFFSSRFRLPLLPYFFLLAAYPISRFEEFRARRRIIAVPAALFCAMIGILSFYPPVTPSKTNAPQYELAQSTFYFNKGDYTQALIFARQALSIDSSYVDANLAVGSCFFRLGVADSALAYYEKELRLYPQRNRAYTNLASLLLTKQQPEAASEIIKRSLALIPSDIEANLILLRASAANNDLNTESFYEQVRKSSERTGNDLQIMMEGAVLLSNNGDDEYALALLKDAINSSRPPVETDDNAFDHYYRNSPANRDRMLARIHYQLGFILGRQEIFGESIRYSKKAIELDPTLVEAYINLIGGYSSSGQQARADSVLSVASSLFPSKPLFQQRPKH